jgi:hypothetical protein
MPSMDTNDVEPEPAGIAPYTAEAEVDAPRPSLLRSAWRGAKTGFRLTSYIVGPIAGVGMLLGNALRAFGLGAGRGWGEPEIVSNAFLFYLIFAVWGAIFGAGFGLVGAVIRRVWPGAFRASGWSVFQRPVHLFGRRPDPAASVKGAPPGRPRRRWLRLVGIPTLVILPIAFGTGIYLWRIVDRRLADAISAADRDDPYWRLDDLMAHRDPVPDEENSALIVAEVLSMVPEGWPKGPMPTDGVPAPPLPTELMKADERMVTTADNVRLDDATAAVLRNELKALDEAVKIARTVADYPRGRHEVELGPTLLDTLLPETQASRTVARLLRADAAIRVHDGDPDGALDSCRANLCTARSIGDEPFAISQLVRLAIGMVTMQSTRRVLGQGEPSDAALARLQALILDELGQPLLLHGNRGERAALTELIRRLGAGEVPISALSGGGPKFDPDAPHAAIAPLGKRWFDYQRAIALEWLTEAVAIGRRPVAEHPRLWEAWDAEIVRTKRSRFGIYTAPLPLLLMPALYSSSSAHSRYQCELGATAILLAAERHRRKAGDWPASIASIDPSILPVAPVDPFSGQAFRMEHRDGQLFIYSIGPNRKDEHGAYDPKKWAKGTTEDDAGAVAWDVPLRRQPPPPEDEPVGPEPAP